MRYRNLHLQDELEDYRDLRALREEKSSASGEPTRSLDEVLKDIAEQPEPGGREIAG